MLTWFTLHIPVILNKMVTLIGTTCGEKAPALPMLLRLCIYSDYVMDGPSMGSIVTTFQFDLTGLL